MGIGGMNGWELITAGGPMLVPIVLCSFFAIAIMIEKYRYLSTLGGSLSPLKSEIFKHLQENRFKEAALICEGNPSPAARILKAAILKFGSPITEIKETIESTSLEEIPKLEKRLGTLSTIIHLTPLLGLLGTVMGLIGCFQTI